MPSFTTEGIVLRHNNFGEADRILTVLTPYKGKLKVLAKGIRRITSRRAGNVEPLNKVKVHIFTASGMPILQEAESLKTFSKIKDNLILSTYALYVLEITDRLIVEGQLHKEVYNLLLGLLELLEKNPRQIFIRGFEVKLLTELGFWSADQLLVSSNLKALLKGLESLSWVEIDKLKLTKNQSIELEGLLRYHIEKILESPLKSIQLINKLKEKNEF